MEGVNLFRWDRATPCLGPHRGCYLRRILGGDHYNQHYGGKETSTSSEPEPPLPPGEGEAGHASTRQPARVVIEIPTR